MKALLAFVVLAATGLAVDFSTNWTFHGWSSDTNAIPHTNVLFDLETRSIGISVTSNSIITGPVEVKVFATNTLTGEWLQMLPVFTLPPLPPPLTNPPTLHPLHLLENQNELGLPDERRRELEALKQFLVTFCGNHRGDVCRRCQVDPENLGVHFSSGMA